MRHNRLFYKTHVTLPAASLLRGEDPRFSQICNTPAVGRRVYLLTNENCRSDADKLWHIDEQDGRQKRRTQCACQKTTGAKNQCFPVVLVIMADSPEAAAVCYLQEEDYTEGQLSQQSNK